MKNGKPPESRATPEMVAAYWAAVAKVEAEAEEKKLRLAVDFVKLAAVAEVGDLILSVTGEAIEVSGVRCVMGRGHRLPEPCFIGPRWTANFKKPFDGGNARGQVFQSHIEKRLERRFRNIGGDV